MKDNERHRSIAEAAYLKAEQRGFSGNGELEDWLEAEMEFNERLARISHAMRNESSEKRHESRNDAEQPSVPPSS